MYEYTSTITNQRTLKTATRSSDAQTVPYLLVRSEGCLESINEIRRLLRPDSKSRGAKSYCTQQAGGNGLMECIRSSRYFNAVRSTETATVSCADERASE